MQDGVDDADNDPSNEYNTSFVLNGTNLEITDAGGIQTVDISSLSGTGTDNQKFKWCYINRDIFTDRY